MAMGLAVLGVVSCLKLPDPIERDIQSVKDRSVPPGGRLIPSYGRGREGQVLRAAWEIETDMTWNAYAAWVVAQLPEFQVRANDAVSLRLSRPLEGDVYMLTFRRKPAGQSRQIEVAFEARPL
jgi:hypothetical protein